ncbi:TPA: MarR family transcriptional regulator [Enterobacter cloacae]|jgi:DNA-binding MarR family transcriptional regulator|uniref:MarR family transcriptional regulator n=2 Tax=Pseudomonadota TaxID=1224 RepID=A0A2W6I968_STEMA|nr:MULTISPECIES: MarR family transcriptional regulator [Gammaproteobacteria]ECD6934049.1 MarR family transcriptional regulator [Salmonella enterica subsp. enterica serovar Saintpaul]EHI8216793.1 MarR family transcriptional regulator [Salmonella enterica]MED5491700.1 MarR family transcriptional regulator [Pseudomonadota bacterium]QOH68910.1 MarR family transcriptional regulator [Pseudomonas putida]HAS1061208.1 MarR family transcriptional regulator [Enterobacter cloacae]
MTLTDSLKRLQWHMWHHWRQYAQHSGSMELSNSELDYLYALISAEHGLRLTELAERMNVSKASASAMASKLEARGYLQRLPCTEDGRAMRLLATAKSNALEQEERDVYVHTAASLAEHLSPEEMQQLSHLLAKACQSLETD